MTNIPLNQYWHLLARYLKPQRSKVFWLAFTLLSSIALQLLNPQILRYFIDTAIAGGAQSALFTAALLFISIAFLTQLFTVIAAYFGETVAWTATNALRTDLTAHCLGLDLSFYKSHTPGELVERVDGDVQALSEFFSQFTIRLLGSGLLLIGILIILFAEDWRIGTSLSLFALTALLILLRLQTFAIPIYVALNQANADFLGFVGEVFSGTKDIRANGAVSYVMHRFHQFLQHWLPLYHRGGMAEIILWGTSIGLFVTGNAIALAIGAYLWSQQAISIGTIYLIFYYANLLNDPIERIQQELESLQKAGGGILRIQELLQLRSQLKPSGNQSLPSGALSVAVENVWFSYEDISTPQLQNISFSLPAGQVLGIIGRTGSGKTTLARLLLRLYDPQVGAIRLGDISIEQTPLQNLRQRVMLVTQDVQLFQTTVRNNLTFFDPQISDRQLLYILDLLGLSAWLHALPQGLDTLLSASGGLSAGQAQLLAFARIFIQNPSLVILDEASSRLDPSTEALIERAVDRLFQNRTGIIIAHRLTTVQRADQILILERGQMIEYGDRQMLINNPNSRFAQLLKMGLTDAYS